MTPDEQGDYDLLKAHAIDLRGQLNSLLDLITEFPPHDEECEWWLFKAKGEHHECDCGFSAEARKRGIAPAIEKIL